MRAAAEIDDEDAKILGTLAEHYDEVSPRIMTVDLMAKVQMEWVPLVKILKRFDRYGLVRSMTLQDTEWEIAPETVEIVRQFKAPPPPRDRIKEIEVWFRSQWWSVPLILLAAIPPVIYSWFSLITDAVSWFSDTR